MSEIPDIEVRDISIPYMPPWAYRTTPVTPLEPPVTSATLPFIENKSFIITP